MNKPATNQTEFNIADTAARYYTDTFPRVLVVCRNMDHAVMSAESIPALVDNTVVHFTTIFDIANEITGGYQSFDRVLAFLPMRKSEFGQEMTKALYKHELPKYLKRPNCEIRIIG